MQWVSWNYRWWKRLSKWHDWFAWFPVRVENNRIAWLETVRRSGRAADDMVLWDYKSRTNSDS